jgi:hypothetical protein
MRERVARVKSHHTPSLSLILTGQFRERQRHNSTQHTGTEHSIPPVPLLHVTLLGLLIGQLVCIGESHHTPGAAAIACVHPSQLPVQNKHVGKL